MSAVGVDDQTAGNADERNPSRRTVRSRKVSVVLALCLLGPIAGMLVILLRGPLYESESQVLIHYVIEQSAQDGDGYRRIGETELDILNSGDLAVEVAETIGPERLVSANSRNEQSIAMAADVVGSGLTVEKTPESPAIVVKFRCADPDLAVEVLETLRDSYLDSYFEEMLAMYREATIQMADERKAEMARVALQLSEARNDPEADPLTIRSLEERLEQESAAWQHIQSTLEKERLNGGLGPWSMPGIAPFSDPSAAKRVHDENAVTLAIILAVLGPCLGLVFGLIQVRRSS